MFKTIHFDPFDTGVFYLFLKSSAKLPKMRKTCSLIVLALGGLLLITGCASSHIDAQPDSALNEQLPRPDHILVYDFVPLSPGQVNAAEQAQIGSEIAAGVIDSIRGMGLPAEQASSSTPLQINDIVIKGQVVSLNEGSAAERVAIGFGKGASELKVQVQGYQVTPQGLRRLGSGTDDAGGGKTPGAALGAVGAIATANPAGLIISTGMKVYGEASGSSKVEGRSKQIVEDIAARLKTRFQQQGWIP